MARVGELFISLRASTASFSKDLKRSTKLTKQSAQAMSKAFKIAAVAIAAAGAALAVLVKKSIDTADRMAKMSREIGISTETLSVLKREAELGGTNLETLSTGLQRLARNLSDAQNGLVTAKRAFSDLGIEVLDSNGKLRNLEEVTLEVATKFSQMEDGTRKTARAMELMGRGGVQLINTLNTLGEKGFAQARKEAELFGEIVSKETAVAAEKFNDNLRDLQAIVKGLGITIAANLLPHLNQLTDSAKEFATKGEGMKKVAEEITLGLKRIAAAAIAVKTTSEIAILGLGALGQATGQLLLKGIIFAFDEIKAILAQAEVEMGAAAERGSLLLVSLFEEPKKQIEEDAGKIRKELGKVQAAITDLNKVKVESPVDKPPFDQNALISQREELEFIRRALGGIPSDVQTIGGAFEAVTPKLALMKDIGQEFTDTLSFGFSNLIARGGTLSDVFKRLTADLAAMLARLAILRVIGGIFGGLFGGGGAAATVTQQAGGISGFQHGGTLRAGQVGIVGEGGEPELIAAGVTSSITPLSKLGGVTVSQHFDFRGAGPGVMSEVKRGMRQLQSQTLAIARAQASEAALRSA